MRWPFDDRRASTRGGVVSRRKFKRPSLARSPGLRIEALESRKVLAVLPTIGSLTSSPPLVASSQSFTLTASSVQDADPSRTIQQVVFYRDSNNDGVLQTQFDTLLATDTNGTDGWQAANISASGLSGVQTLFAVAIDDLGQVGPAARTIATVAISDQAIDNGQAGFATAGSGWTASTSSACFNANFLYAAAAQGGGKTATWTFGVQPGALYQVTSSWKPATSNTNAAQYTMYDNATSIGQVSVNQQLAAGETQYAGVNWGSLGYFTTTSTTLKVQLSNVLVGSAGNVVADGVRILRVVENPWTVDDGDAGGVSTYSEPAGAWATDSSAGYGGSQRVGSGVSSAARWTFAAVDPQQLYQVQMSWAGTGGSRSAAAPWTLYNGQTAVFSGTVNQQSAPSGGWQTLGYFRGTSGSLAVALSSDGSGSTSGGGRRGAIGPGQQCAGADRQRAERFCRGRRHVDLVDRVVLLWQ